MYGVLKKTMGRTLLPGTRKQNGILWPRLPFKGKRLSRPHQIQHLQRYILLNEMFSKCISSLILVQNTKYSALHIEIYLKLQLFNITKSRQGAQINSNASVQEGRYTPYGTNSPQTENRQILFNPQSSSATTSSLYQAYDEQKAVS